MRKREGACSLKLYKETLGHFRNALPGTPIMWHFFPSDSHDFYRFVDKFVFLEVACSSNQMSLQVDSSWSASEKLHPSLKPTLPAVLARSSVERLLLVDTQALSLRRSCFSAKMCLYYFLPSGWSCKPLRFGRYRLNIPPVSFLFASYLLVVLYQLGFSTKRQHLPAHNEIMRQGRNPWGLPKTFVKPMVIWARLLKRCARVMFKEWCLCLEVKSSVLPPAEEVIFLHSLISCTNSWLLLNWHGDRRTFGQWHCGEMEALLKAAGQKAASSLKSLVCFVV